MAGIPLDKAELLALLLETLFYGIFLTLFILLVVMSFVERKIRIANQSFILPVAALMMVLATAHLILDFARLVQAFTTGVDPIKYYSLLNHPTMTARLVIYIIQTLLGDGVLVWRCYIVWNKARYVLVPGVIMVLANFALGIVVIWSFIVAAPGRSVFTIAVQFITTFFITTVGINLTCSVAIAFKIWTTRRSAPSTLGVSLVPIIVTIIESGAIYSVSVLTTLIAYLSGSNAESAVVDLITPLVGVVFCLIVVQIHFHLRVSHALRKGATSNWSIPPSWRRHVAQRESIDINSKPRPQRGSVMIHITEHVEAHSDLWPKTHMVMA